MPRKPAVLSEAEQVAIDAERVLAEAARHRAEAAKFEAQAEWHRLEGAKAEAEAALFRTQTETEQIALRREQRREKAELAKDAHHHVYVFGNAVGADSVRKCIEQLTEWMRCSPGCDIELVFDSPGGSVIDGMHLWDFLSLVKSKGHQLTTVALGMAASMAGILLQAGDLRVLGRESYLLIHEVSFGAGGKIGEVEDEVAFVRKIQSRVLDIFAARSNLTRRQIENRWRRKDWWLDSTEALKLGFVDSVR